MPVRHCVAVHMVAVLWSAVLHAALHSTQILQLLHKSWFLMHYIAVLYFMILWMSVDYQPLGVD